MKLAAVEYEMIYDNPTQKKTIGFIAQEVKKYFPEIASTSGNEKTGYDFDNLEAMNYDGFATLAIKAIQEQQQVIKNLKARINDVKNRLQQLQLPTDK